MANFKPANNPLIPKDHKCTGCGKGLDKVNFGVVKNKYVSSICHCCRYKNLDKKKDTRPAWKRREDFIEKFNNMEWEKE